MTLVRLDHISKAFAGTPVLQDISWQIEDGRKIGLIGVNGSGKSTLLHLLSGTLQADSGRLERARGLRLGHLTQTMVVEGRETLYNEVREAFRPLLDMQDDMALLEIRMAQDQASESDMQQYGVLLDEFNARQGYAIQARVEATLFGLGFRPEDLAKSVAQLSGGQKNMAALARVLLQEPDLLLLDEPSNHLDIVATEWLEGILREYRGTVVVVSHDRYFLDRTVGEIVALENQHLNPYRGNYSAYVTARAARLEQQRQAYEQQQAEIRRQEEFIRRNMAGQKTRQAQSRQKALERLEPRHKPITQQRQMALNLTSSQRESHEVVVCRKVRKSFGDHLVLRDLSCTVYRGDKVGLMGPNGAGKSTLLRLLMGHDTPDRGTIRLGRHVSVAYYDQELRDLHPQHTVLDEVWQVEPWQTAEVIRRHLGRFLFTGDEVLQTVGSLSGGEQSRVALAKLILTPANFLLLDEPTNHLDIPAREALEQALSIYPGTVLVVSHDRYFLDRIITRLLYMRSGTCEAYAGNYSAYQAHLAAPAVAAPLPRSPSRPQARAASTGPRPTRRRKLRIIEQDISQAEAELATLQAAIEGHQDSVDWQYLAELTTHQGTVAARLETLMHEWENAMAAREEKRP
ncbi:Energy-dependent translational throttle protein EttA [Candidatus Entotheonellaceae bacterium PAL068K]